MKIPSSQRQPLNKTNGGGGGVGEMSEIFREKLKWEGLHSVGWGDVGVAVLIPESPMV